MGQVTMLYCITLHCTVQHTRQGTDTSVLMPCKSVASRGLDTDCRLQVSAGVSGGKAVVHSDIVFGPANGNYAIKHQGTESHSE